ncbi:hypothetical protein AYI68_g5860 [Smittium mucronatum]|uniref:Endonuclease/exonuclease/phosphatase domain-containing protein n=1 Tax=Smittium mucronatum TaxID=133383 RepID=A0A1R0GT37_9FUNG|nr:hypothetical protein AYI68_g5860 [Smittium mucronatum]
MNVPSARNYISRLGLSHQKAKITNSPSSRYNKGEIGRMIDHIFYVGLSGRENWCTANKNLDISDHMPITAEWNFISLEIPAKKIKINGIEFYWPQNN